MKLLSTLPAAAAIVAASTTCLAFRGSLQHHHHHHHHYHSARKTHFVTLHASSSSGGKSGKFSDAIDGIVNGRDASDLEEKVSVDDVILGVLEGADLGEAEDDSVDIRSAVADGGEGVAGAHFVRGEMDGEISGEGENEVRDDDDDDDDDDDEETRKDKEMMRQAIFMAQSGGGERGTHGPFPRPICGAVLVAKDGRVSLTWIFAELLRTCRDFGILLRVALCDVKII